MFKLFDRTQTQIHRKKREKGKDRERVGGYIRKSKNVNHLQE